MTKNYTYAFVFGTHPKLSFGELSAVLQNDGIVVESLVLRNTIGWLETATELAADDLMMRLGGTTKIVQVVGTFDDETVADYLLSRVNRDSKFHFGFSLYALEPGISTKKSLKTLHTLGIALKKTFKADEISCRFVSSQEVELSSVIVHKERLLKNGVEIVILKAANEILFGATLAVQPFQDWSHRDYGRPARDDRSGMLPPKLARMMLNLSGATAMDTVLDPFCGSGTVLQEAVLLGCKKIIGTDVSKKAVADTRENMEWLKQETGKYVEKIAVCDARELLAKKIIAPESIDRIVFEGYLGKTTPNAKAIEQQLFELEKLYRDTFIILERALSKNGTIVAALPFWTLSKAEIIHLPIKKLLAKSNLKIVDAYFYRRPQSVVGREIIVLKK